jgi:hypothetical protein
MNMLFVWTDCVVRSDVLITEGVGFQKRGA